VDAMKHAMPNHLYVLFFFNAKDGDKVCSRSAVALGLCLCLHECTWLPMETRR
jgi:hypothetical protein